MKAKLCLLAFSLVFVLMRSGIVQATTFELRSYFKTLSPPLSEQSTNDLWTFQNKDHNQAFLPPHPNLRQYYDYTVTGSIVGDLIPAGEPASGKYASADSYPTFNGVFVHSGSKNPTAAVFHAPESMRISKIELWSEMVGGGLSVSPPPPANGFDVKVKSVISGITNTIASFTFSGPSRLKTIYFPPTLDLQEGDMLEILYGNNGDYRFDHGNVNVFISANHIPKHLDIDIDIKPGIYPNTVKLSSKGAIPVAILTTAKFDASMIDPAAVTFADASPIRWKITDVDKDGDSDMLLSFTKQELNLNGGSTAATLKGHTTDGITIEGSDSVVILQPGKN